MSTPGFDFKKGWKAFSDIATLITGIVAGFLTPPPAASDANVEAVTRLGQFLATVLTGLILVVVRARSRKRDAKPWWIAALATLILGVAAIVADMALTEMLTCKYGQRTVLVGLYYTDHAKQYLGKNPGLPCEQLILDYAGQIELIWPRKALVLSRLLLSVAYMACIPLFVICAISVVQAYRCGSPARTRPGKASEKVQDSAP